MDTIRNVTQLLIGKDLTTVAVDGALISVPGDLVDGEIVLCTPQNIVTDGTDPFTKVKFIQRSGDELIHSDIIDLARPAFLRSYEITAATAESEQLDYIGWNGTTGAFVGVASNIYTIRLNILDKTTAGFMQQKIKEGFYKSNANASSYSQSAIAFGLVASLRANYSRETEQDIEFRAVTDEAGVNTTGTIATVKGSKYITCAAGGGVIDAPTVGLGVRLGTALTDPVVLVEEAIGGGVYRINVEAYDTETIAIAGADKDVAITGDWGVKINGADREYKRGHYWSNVVFWVTQPDFGDLAGDVLLTTTAAYPGTGTGDYVNNLEFELQADEFIYRGFAEQAGVTYRNDAVTGSGVTYDLMAIEYMHQLDSAQGTPTESPKTLEIAWYKGDDQSATVGGYWEALLTLLGIPYTSQVAKLTP